MHNQFQSQQFKHLMLAMGPRDLNSAPYSPVHCSSHSMTSFQSSELTELPVVENSQLFAQRVHSARTAHGTPPFSNELSAGGPLWGGGVLGPAVPATPWPSISSTDLVQLRTRERPTKNRAEQSQKKESSHSLTPATAPGATRVGFGRGTTRLSNHVGLSGPVMPPLMLDLVPLRRAQGAYRTRGCRLIVPHSCESDGMKRGGTCSRGL